MVLHEQDRELELLTQPLHEGAELGHLLVVQAAGGLVEEEQAGLRDQRARELDAFLRPIRQRRRREVRAIFEAHHAEHCQRVALVRLSTQPVRADEDVLEHRHRPEKLDVLEGARDALLHDLVRRRPEDGLAVELDRSRVGLVQTRDYVERRGLSGAVRPDQA